MKKRNRKNLILFIGMYCLFGLDDIFSAVISTVLSSVTGGAMSSLTDKKEKTIPAAQSVQQETKTPEVGAEASSTEKKKRKGKSALTIQRTPQTGAASTGGAGTGASL